MYTKYGLSMYYGASAKLFEFAKELRGKPTEAEEAMWQILKASPLSEYKFRRQHPISSFIADFYCHDLKIVIEIDGQYHLQKEQAELDSFRDEDMRALGIKVVRFTNTEVLEGGSNITSSILESIRQQSSVR